MGETPRLGQFTGECVYIYILYIHKFLIRQVFPLPPYLMHHLYIQCTYISIYIHIHHVDAGSVRDLGSSPF